MRIARFGVGLCVSVVIAVSPAWAWRYESGHGNATSVVLHPGGDVIAVGTLLGDFVVERLAASGTPIWEHRIDGDEIVDEDAAARAVIDGAGGVVAVGKVETVSGDFAVVKMDADSGAVLWRMVTGNGNDFARAVAVDAAGDVIAAGTYSNGPNLVVRKLAGATGTQIWERIITGADPGGSTFDGAYDVALDAGGNVVVGGTVDGAGFVAKLDAVTGADLWNAEVNGAGFSWNAVAIDASGDVVVASNLTVVKLAAATGGLVWRQDTLASSGSSGDLDLDGAGDAIAVGSFGGTAGGFAVVKVDGGTGALLWTREIRGAGFDNASAVAVDASGDVTAAGQLESVRTGNDLAVVKFDGATGAELWRQTLDGFLHDAAFDVTIGPTGHAFASGRVADLFAVERLDGDTGAVGPVAGGTLAVRDRAGTPSARRIIGTLRTPVVSPPVGSAGDPTLSGGVVQLSNPVSLETATLPLPASGWVGLGNPPGAHGYRYLDATGANGPCKRLRVRHGLIKVNCQGSGVPFTLDEPFQSSLTLSVQLGSSDAQCARFGGVVRDASTTNPGPTGSFLARDAAPGQGTCP